VPKFVADSSTSTGLKWAAPAGGGKVLQVVNATYSTNVSNATSTFADTGLTASITPTLATSNILVIVNQVGLGKATGTTSGVMGRLVRGATTIVSEFVGNGGYTGTNATNYFGGAGLSYLDSPATTSSTTYKTQFKNFENTSAVYAQNENASSSITLIEIGV